ncbi:MAG: heavy metal translocating P-type ATPase metal-binding domain-containing protein [Verrucomicrobia bacterium]|nr:heavy metal translocating P-type ATPase metal-binding domain-containing protein [Verrucomicrobiota bacterium]
MPSPQGEFCCSGCAYVYRMIHEAGLESYYRIKDEVTVPADSALLPARDYDWLKAAQTEAELIADDKTSELSLDVQGISCAGCVWLIEKLHRKQSGSGRIEVNAQTGQMRLAWAKGSFDAVAFARTLQSFNYLVSPASAERSAAPESRAMLKRIGLCAAFAMNVMLFTLPVYFGMEPTYPYARLFSTLSMAFATLSLLAGGGYFIGRALRGLREGAMAIDLPIALGIVGAYSGSLYGWLIASEPFIYFDFVATFILLMLTGRWAQLVAVERNQRRLLAQQPTPPRVRLWDEAGVEKDCAPESLQSGQRFAVGPGQTLPVEARLETPEGTFSLAWINGESEPRVFRAGQRVPAGATNVSHSEIRLQATQAWAQSLLAELFKPVTRGVYRQRFLENVIRGYLIAVLVISVGAAIGWGWATGDALRTGAIVTAILVVSCPCAIGLAFPLADELATTALRKRGVFVRVADLWPRLERVQKIVFDKTGTLTLETPALTNPEALCALDAEARAALFTLVSDNLHPVGRCLHEQLLATGRPTLLAGEVTEIIGAGVMLESGCHRWSLGRSGWGGAEKCHVLRDTIQETTGEGVVASAGSEAEVGAELACDGLVRARFHFAEKARLDAREEIAALQARDLEVSILSGDRRTKVEALARELGLNPEHVRAEFSPHDKASWIEQHGADDAMMLGDGANDSLAFDQALCRGTPVIHRGLLAQKADFYYLGRGIGGIRSLFEVNDARRRTHRWLLVFSISYNLLAVGMAVSDHMNPLVAAILMPLSSLLSLAIVAQGMRGVNHIVAQN